MADILVFYSKSSTLFCRSLFRPHLHRRPAAWASRFFDVYLWQAGHSGGFAGGCQPTAAQHEKDRKYAIKPFLFKSRALILDTEHRCRKETAMPACNATPSTRPKNNKMNIMTLGVALLLAGATSSSLMDSRSAQASEIAKDLRLLDEAKISLTAAIEIAEKHVGGKAIEADLDRENGKAVYDVSVIKAQKEYDVRLDAVTGDVLRVKEETP